MTRIERISKHARHEGWMCAMWISGAVALGVWAAVAGLYAKKSGGAFLALLAIVALRLASWHWSERRRLKDKVMLAERVWNPPAPERPAHTANESDAVIWLTLAVAFGVPAIAAAVHLIWKFNH